MTQAIQNLSNKINALWQEENPDRNLIDLLQGELTNLRNEAAGPIVLPENWACSTGDWFDR